MKTEPTNLPGVLIVEPRVFNDPRGYFYESWQQNRYEAAGITGNFVQDNVSFSEKGALRGLHFQNPHTQGKLVSVLEGEVFDVAVDIRPNSPSFKKWTSVVLSSKNRLQLWVPPGFAHGFYVTSSTALVSYKCTDFYSPQSEHTLIWNDPEIAIDWPSTSVNLSEKDAKGIPLKSFTETQLPRLS